jgi:hypothetical protein
LSSDANRPAGFGESPNGGLHAANAETRPLLPASLSLLDTLVGLDPTQRHHVSLIQARSFLNFTLTFRAVRPMVMDHFRNPPSRNPQLFDEGRYVGMSIEPPSLALKMADQAIATRLPEWYRFLPTAQSFASVFQGRSLWAIVVAACLLGFSAQEQVRSFAQDANLHSPLLESVVRSHANEQLRLRSAHVKALSRASPGCVKSHAVEAEDFVEVLRGCLHLMALQAWADTDVLLSIHSMDTIRVSVSELRTLFKNASLTQFISLGLGRTGLGSLLEEFMTADALAELEEKLAALLDGAVGF